MFVDKEGVSQWPELRFELMWTEHGGAGLGLQFSEVNELDFADIVWLVERVREQRRTEANALKSAARRR